VIPGVGQRADNLDGFFCPGPVGQPAGQPPPGVLVPAGGALAKLIGLVVFGQQIRLPPPFGVFGGLAWRTDHGNSLAMLGRWAGGMPPLQGPGCCSGKYPRYAVPVTPGQRTIGNQVTLAWALPRERWRLGRSLPG